MPEIDTLGFEVDTWLKALKWWHSLTLEQQAEYERKFMAGVDRRLELRFKNEQWKLYAIYLMVKLME